MKLLIECKVKAPDYIPPNILQPEGESVGYATLIGGLDHFYAEYFTTWGFTPPPPPPDSPTKLNSQSPTKN